MMKLPSPMNTSRVREALVAVANYVEFVYQPPETYLETT